MASKPDSYPSPAPQPGASVASYPPAHQDPTHDALDINAHLHGATSSAANEQPPHSHHDGNASPVHMNTGAGLASAVAQHLNQEGYYAQPPQASTPQPYQGPIPGISGPLPTNPADDSGRKKTKVTRACDECRRKKIKCDAENDGPGAARCSNCQRTSAECKFSRAPQKRGPSKGYIKELSDRVAQLENAGRGYEFDSASPVPPSMGGGERKRTFSMADNGIYDASTNVLEKYRPELPKTFAPAAIPEANMALPAADPTIKPKNLGIELATPESYHPAPLRPLHHVENHHLELFLNKVNRFFPLLGSRDGINANLQFCPPPLRQAFYYAVGSVVGTIEHTSGEQTRLQCANCVYNMMNTAAPPGPLSERMFPPESRPWQANLVYLQVLLLLVIHQESAGPMHDDPFGSFTKDQLLQQARRMVDYLQLRQVTEAAHLGTSSPEANRIFSSARRAYWIFVVLDIWNSLSSRSARQLPMMSVDAELTEQDKSLLGTEFWHFVRRSSVAAMLADQLKSESVQAPELRTLGYWLMAMQNTAAADSTNSNVAPTMKSAPLAVIAQAAIDLFCTLLMAGPQPCPPTSAIVEAACALAARLAAVDNVPEGTPLTHHFVVVAAKALVDASRFPPQRQNARVGLQNMLTAVRSKGLLDTSHWHEPVVAAILERLEDDKGGVAMEVEGGNHGGNGVVGAPAEVEMNASAQEMEHWKSSWPLLVWEGYLRTSI